MVVIRCTMRDRSPFQRFFCQFKVSRIGIGAVSSYSATLDGSGELDFDGAKTSGGFDVPLNALLLSIIDY